MDINISKDISLPCIKPLYDTWGAKSEAGNWSITLTHDFSKASIKERNAWYADTMLSTIDAFASLARINLVYFSSVGDPQTRLEGESFEWQPDESYNYFVTKVDKAIRDYAADISSIFINVDLFVYVYTEEFSNKPARAWVRRFGQSVEMGQFEIYLEHSRYKENYVYFDISHMLFYPDSWNYQEDNTELANLNQPLLEEVLRKWEKKFDAEIEADGLPGIYKYGYLLQDQW